MSLSYTAIHITRILLTWQKRVVDKWGKYCDAICNPKGPHHCDVRITCIQLTKHYCKLQSIQRRIPVTHSMIAPHDMSATLLEI